MATQSPKPLWRRAMRFVGLALASTAALVVALALAVDLLSNLPFARRLAMRELNHVLGPQFKGRITL